LDVSIRRRAEELYEKYIDKGHTKIMNIFGSQYPELLKHIDTAPLVLFYRGNPGVLTEKSLGIIGSRRATSYGLNAAYVIAGDLARAGYCIVSGMARGIDSHAHRSALDAGGTTCAVLGCGTDIAYPPENKSLMEEIIEKGVLVSEYPPETLPLGQNFPARNRIISGLSKGLLVVEAGKRSGTLITANFALEQGRDVYAVPGSIFSLKSAGTNDLIKDGAIVVTSSDDILKQYSGSLQLYKLNPAGLKGKLLEAIASGTTRLEDIIAENPGKIPEIMSELAMLEMEGLVSRMSNGEYRLEFQEIK